MDFLQAIDWSRSLPKSQMNLKTFGKLLGDDVIRLHNCVQSEWMPFEEKKLFIGQVVGHIPYENKVDMSYWVSNFKQTPIFEWCMGGCESKNKNTRVKNILDYVMKIC